MKLFSTTPSVLDAEQRLEQSKQQLHRQLDQIQSGLTLLSSLLAIGGVGAMLGSWLARRKVTMAAPDTGGGRFPVRSLVFTLLMRFILQRIRA
jgi:hypothetical protein